MSLTLTLERGGGEVSGSGTNIELDGTIAGGAIESVEMYGDTEQTTYSGKNLLNQPSSWSFTRWTNFQPLSAGTYYVSCGAVTKGGANDPQIGDSAAHISITSNMLNKVLNFTGTALTVYSNGWSWGDSSVTSTVENLIITTSPISSIADYEPYVGGTASPNPDYPQEVQTVTGRQVVIITDSGSQSQEYEINLGKNLFDKDNANIYNGWVNDSQVLKDNASTTCVYVRCEPNTTYTIQKTNSGTNNRFCVWTTSSQPANDVPVLNYVGTRSGDDNNSSYTITTNKSAKYLGVFFSGGSTTPSVADIEATIQIEKGSTATTYASYFTPIELCKIGDYQDYIYKSGEDWYVHKETDNLSLAVADMNNNEDYPGWKPISKLVTQFGGSINEAFARRSSFYTNIGGFVEQNSSAPSSTGVALNTYGGNNGLVFLYKSKYGLTQTQWKTNYPDLIFKMYYGLPDAATTDTQITNEALIAQLEALNAGDTYEGTTVITVDSENLAGSLEVTAATNIAKTYTEVEIGSPFTIADVEGKSSNTTLDGNVYVDWAYNKKQYSFDLFNLTPQDYADIRAYYDYQFSNSAFPTITVPELNITRLPVYMEISSRNIINQCLLTDKLTIKFRETVQP